MMQGLLADLERKNCWTIAEHLGHRDPEALQNLLSRAKWDDDGPATTYLRTCWTPSATLPGSW